MSAGQDINISTRHVVGDHSVYCQMAWKAKSQSKSKVCMESAFPAIQNPDFWQPADFEAAAFQATAFREAKSKEWQRIS